MMGCPRLLSTATRERSNMAYLSPHLLTPPNTPQPSDLQKTIDSILLQFQLSSAKIENLPRHHLHSLLAIHLSNHSQLVLKISPPATTLLLRHEHNCLRSEAAALTILAKSPLPLPRVLKYEPTGTLLGSPFLLTNHLPGLHYSDALPYLTTSEKLSIETQLQSLQAIISQHSCPYFGLVASVGFGKANVMYKTWREAFIAMLEDVLRDGEDMMVNISYFKIREAVSKWGSHLDGVSEAKLVVLGLDNPENVLIERRTNAVVGLLDFGTAVWGDPAMATSKGNSDIKSLLYVHSR